MIWDELESRELTTRKAHECEWCAERIEKGEACQFRKFIGEDNVFMRGWAHDECWKAMKTADAWDLQCGWMPGDWKRGSTEPRDDECRRAHSLLSDGERKAFLGLL